MTRRRPDPSRLVALVLLTFLAQALLPRASWYAHRHAGGAHEHVHEWDGSRVAGSSASLHDLLPHGHDHGHEHPHGHRHDHAHGHDHADHGVAIARVQGSHDEHDPRPATAHDADGPGFVASHDGAHAHGQAPFQTALAAHVPDVGAPRPHRPTVAAVHPSPLLAQGHALRARGPPHSSV